MRQISLLVLVSGCCGKIAPVWKDVDPVYLDGESRTVELADLVLDDKGVTAFFVEYDNDSVIAEIAGDSLTITPQPGFLGTTMVAVEATDKCDNSTITEILVDGSGDPATTGDCAVTLTWSSPNAPEQVGVAASFNDFDPESTPMESVDGLWQVTLELDPGAYPYKFVEFDGLFDDTGSWTCDPNAPLIHCDPDTSWDHSCSPGAASCNSLLVVEPCGPPVLDVVTVDIDRTLGSANVVVTGSGVEQASATLDGAAIDIWDGSQFTAALTGLTPGRHTLRFSATNDSGGDDAYVPFWTDDFVWEDAVLYFAFVDRLANGDASLDVSEGATGSGYEGGDFQGVIDVLPYLDDLGVNVVWLSNAQDNAEGAWAGDCDATYSGYHAYWPDDPYGVEEHFGDDSTLHDLIDASHARGMRVMMDWVANHVHSDHPYYAEHPEWFNSQEICKDQVGGQLNFDRIPETCWFAPYLPDIDYSQPDPLVLMVDDAMWWATEYELDGFRVDAVKHMSHAVAWNLRSSIKEHITHEAAGGDERFLTIGETFDSTPKIQEYIGDNQLDGQFDFPMYYALRGAFAYSTVSLPDLMATWDASQSDFAGATMSNFLGNHDVLRFTTDAVDGWQDPCLGAAQAPTDPWSYDRIKLAWTFLFTQPGIPMIYYGDELGMPGFSDPDNRQTMWSHAGPIAGGRVQSVNDLAGQVSANQASVLRHVAALANARADHPALRRGGWTEWWREDDLFGYARSDGADHALVIINRSETPRNLVNGLAFGGLPTDGRYIDVLTGAEFVASGDSIDVPVDARGSRVLMFTP